jgi:DNA-binding YbaB/EbfC family protein
MFGNMEFLKEQQEKLDKKLMEERITADAGGGQVVVVANGKGELQDISITPSLLEKGDNDEVEDLVLLAVNDVFKKAMDLQASESQDLLSGLLPGM